MIKIYHNPRCRKSREGLAIIEKSNKKFEIVRYLDDIPSAETLTEIIKLLGIPPIQLVRKTETSLERALQRKGAIRLLKLSKQ